MGSSSPFCHWWFSLWKETKAELRAPVPSTELQVCSNCPPNLLRRACGEDWEREEKNIFEQRLGSGHYFRHVDIVG